MSGCDKFSVVRADGETAQNQTFIHVYHAALSSHIAPAFSTVICHFMTNIRFAVRKDAQFLPEIERSSGEAFRQIPDLAWIADDDVQSVERHEDLIQRGSAWVAEAENGVIVGFLNAEILNASFHIWQMAVHTDYQKQGIGQKLVEAAKHFAFSQKLAPLSLTTFRNVVWN